MRKLVALANSPPVANPCSKRQHDDQRRRHTNRRICRRKADHGDSRRHQDDDEKQSGLAAFVIGIKSEQDAAHWAHEKTDAECRCREQQ